MFISTLYMFRAAMCPSSGELIVSIRHLVCVTLYRWSFGVQVWMRLCLIQTCLPMKMEQTECSETSACKIQMLGNYPEENIQHSKHGASSKSSTHCSCSILIRPEYSQQIFEKSSNVKYYKNPSIGSRVVRCGRADMMKLIDSPFLQCC
jgi:hypothetical protein